MTVSKVRNKSIYGGLKVMNSGLHNFITVIVIGLIFLAVCLDPFYSADSIITDRLYTHLSGTDRRIVIIGIDEETLAAYGNFNLWSREKLGELMEFLYASEENKPAVVGLDLILADRMDDENDARLAAAAGMTKGSTVVGTNLVYRGKLERNADGELVYNTEHIDYVEEPYEELREVTVSGFTNECIARDGYIRYAMNSVELYDDEGQVSGRKDSFAYAIYRLYCEKTGEPVREIKTNADNKFQFSYSGKTGEFSELSMEAVLSGKIPASAFKDAIVLVGAYAPGFQDAYQPASDRGTTMYGVEIHANIIQAYLDGKTMVLTNKWVTGAIISLLIGVLMCIGRRCRLSTALIGSGVFALAYVILGMLLASKGFFVPCIYMFIFTVVADLYLLVDNYQRELKKQMWSFTEAMAAAIDERTPYNASHTRNVAKYCGMVADHVNRLHIRGKEREHFSERRKEQLVMGALLHDIGKIAVPLSVMNKATRLGGKEKDIENRLHIFELRAKLSLAEGRMNNDDYNKVSNCIDKTMTVVDKANSAGFVDEETRDELKEVLAYEYEGEAFFTDEEKEALSIVKGTLTDEERRIMESHVSITKRILSKVYFNRYFKNSPLYAGQHHEALNGSGYPDGLKAENLSSDARIMAVCDICDALLATDRPYKKPLPFEKAFAIMRSMAEEGKIDGKYVGYLYDCLKGTMS